MDKNFLTKPSFLVISEPNFFSKVIVEKLVKESCRVFLYANEKNLWEKYLEKSNQESYTEILGSIEGKKGDATDHVVFFCDSQEKEELVDSAINLFKTRVKKFTLLFPLSFFENLSEEEKSKLLRISKTANTQVALIGDLVSGQRNTLVGDILREAVEKRVVTLPKSGGVFLTTKEDARSLLIKNLFSLDSEKAIKILATKRLTYEELFNLIKFSLPKIKRKESGNKHADFSFPAKFVFGKGNLRDSLRNTIEEIFVNRPKVGTTPKSKQTRSKVRDLTLLILVIFFILAPYLFLGATLGLLVLSYFQLSGGRAESAGALFAVSKKMAKTESQVLDFYAKGPLLLFYRPLQTLNNFSYGLASTGRDTSSLASMIVTSVESMGRGEPIAKEDFEKTALLASSVYTQSGFLISDVDENSFLKKFLGAGFFDKIKAERKRVLAISVLLQRAGDLFGYDRPTSYLILFENNNELRPSGGFIGSFALATFDKGAIYKTEIFDVYDADGQLKGHVEPPFPISRYLKEANWYLRDANWDYDFRSSAERIEWFLEKEMDRKVDGVLSIDLSVASSLIDVLGPIYVSDLNLTVTSENLYEIQAKEIEESFFPGSRKKATFLSGLARTLTEKVLELGEGNYFDLVKVVTASLEQRHMQIFLHDKPSQEAIEEVGYSGGFGLPSCGKNCEVDFAAIVEANVGVNKANYFVNREVALSLTFGQDSISHTLSLEFENTANSSSLSKYKVYTRAVIPDGATFENIEIISQKEKVSVSPEVFLVSGRKELGVYTEVDPKTRKKILFYWKTKKREDVGKYKVFYRKQAGTNEYPLTILVDPRDTNLDKPENFVLTKDGAWAYNINLLGDLVVDIETKNANIEP